MQRFVRIRRGLTDLLTGPRVIYHHVPKCGGTSVARALHIRYAVSFAAFPTLPVYRTIRNLHPQADDAERDRLVDLFQERLLLFYLHQDARCVAGHVRFSEVAHTRFSPAYAFITTLRDPVSLMISNFFFQARRPAEFWTTVDDIEAYLESAEARAIGGIYSHYFNGLPPGTDPHEQAAVRRAKQNLERLDLIGLTDDIPDFQRRLRQDLKIRLRIGYANRSKAPRGEKASIITPAVRRRIEELNATNLDIYDFVRSELAHRVAGMAAAGGAAWRLGGA